MTSVKRDLCCFVRHCFCSSLYFLHSLNLKLAKFLHLYEVPWNNSTSQTGKVSCHFEKVFRLLFPHGIRQIGRLFSYFEKVFLYPTNKWGRFFAPFTKLLEKLCFEEHEKRQPLYGKQLSLSQYDVEDLSIYGGISRAHFLEVFVYRAYRS